MRKLLSGFLSIVCIGGAAFAQTVTVAPTGADFTNVRDAVNSFGTGQPNNGIAGDNIVNITQGGTYVEAGAINLSVEGTTFTVRCTDPSASATLVIPGGAVAAGTAMIGMNSPGVTYRLENLVLLPASTAVDGISTRTAGEAIRGGTSAIGSRIELERVMITANNGSNVPASDGTTSATGGFTMVNGSGLRLLSAIAGLSIEHSVLTHCGTFGVLDNGDVLLAAGVPTTSRTLGPDLLISYSGNGTEGSGGYSLGGAGLTGVNGTAAEPVVIANNNGQGFWINSSPNPLYGDVNYMHILNNKSETDGNASGLHIVATQTPNNSRFFKCIIAGNGSGNASGWGNISMNNSQSFNLLFEQCTVFDASPGYPALVVLNGSGVGSLIFRDCVFAGTGDYIASADANTPISFISSALVTTGAHAMDLGQTAGAGETVHPTYPAKYLTAQPISFTDITTADPAFVSVVATNPGFLDVSNAAYATASSTDGPLSGGADYVGVSSISGWMIY